MAWEWYEDLPKDVEAHIERQLATARKTGTPTADLNKAGGASPPVRPLPIGALCAYKAGRWNTQRYW